MNRYNGHSTLPRIARTSRAPCLGGGGGGGWRAGAQRGPHQALEAVHVAAQPPIGELQLPDARLQHRTLLAASSASASAGAAASVRRHTARRRRHQQHAGLTRRAPVYARALSAKTEVRGS